MSRDGWARSAAVFGEAARHYQVAHGAQPGAKSVEATVRTNGELVPLRGAVLLDAIRGSGIEPGDAHLLETGCGFGALAAYLASHGVGSVVGSDVRPDFITLARRSAGMTDLCGSLEFVQADIRDLEPFPDQSFDVVVAAGVLVYLDPAHDLRAALQSILRVLRPGGCVVVYQGSAWWPPAALRRGLGRGRTHAHLRLSGPGATRSALESVGFEKSRAIGLLRDRQLPSRLAAFGSCYVATAQAAAGT